MNSNRNIAVRPIGDYSEMMRARDIYLHAFPPAEQRPWQSILEGCDGCLTLRGIYANEILVGIVTTWNFPQFLYIEHLVVDATLRGKGIGRKALSLVARQAFPLPLLLEVEPEHLNEEAHRRVNFYTRLGFSIIDKTYVQPPYAPYLPPVHLWLMATSAQINPATAAATLHTDVYGVNPNDIGDAGYDDPCA